MAILSDCLIGRLFEFEEVKRPNVSSFGPQLSKSCFKTFEFAGGHRYSLNHRLIHFLKLALNKLYLMPFYFLFI